jgi:hypothetical protein
MILGVLGLILGGCSDKSNNNEIENFTATVLENKGTSLLIEPETNSWIRKSADKISINIDESELLDKNENTISADDIHVGTTVIITFTGELNESYPAQIHNCTKVRLK